MGKASKAKKERREERGAMEREMDRRQAEWDALSDEEKAAREARSEELEREAREFLGREVEAQRRRKDDLVASREAGENDDITPMASVFRDGKLVCTAICSQVDRDQALKFLYMAIPGYAADEVILTTDSHYATNMTNPRTGKEWGPGEMQGLCDNEGACDLGLITDTLWTLSFRRDGRKLFSNSPYHVHKTDRKVAWIHGDHEYFGGEVAGYGTGLQGLVPENIAWYFSKEPLTTEMMTAKTGVKPEDFDLNAETARVHLDCAVTRMIVSVGKGDYAVLMASHSPEAAEIIKRSMERDEGIDTTELDTTDLP